MKAKLAGHPENPEQRQAELVSVLLQDYSAPKGSRSEISPSIASSKYT
ncbi:MAG: hypothetical protein KAU44_00650 [Candidatus Marinimicrobia bacterium]|nr:hypothetical protein [Candidatus Neomarinimicrobiota bacterium]